jgi:fructose-bisphosphate aldolase class I
MNAAQAEKISTGNGFIAALDQSGGSTPGALREYGIPDDEYSNDTEMFDAMHAMRARVVTSPAFAPEKILAAILFEQTMDREIDGAGSAEYLWDRKRVVPFLKVDQGLADQADGVQVMKPVPNLGELLERATTHPIFGTKMRSVVHLANGPGIDAILDQQFELAQEILAHGLVPILEPEVSIKSPEKEAAESALRQGILDRLPGIPAGQQVMLKLTIPSTTDFYAPLISHPTVMRTVALSGGYSRTEACRLLAQNAGLIASFSRALLAGLTRDQSDEQFDRTLAAAVDEIYAASIAP